MLQATPAESALTHTGVVRSSKGSWGMPPEIALRFCLQVPWLLCILPEKCCAYASRQVQAAIYCLQMVHDIFRVPPVGTYCRDLPLSVPKELFVFPVAHNSAC